MFNSDGIKTYNLTTGANYISNKGIKARGGYNVYSSPDVVSTNASIGGSYDYKRPNFGASVSADKIFSSNAAGASKPINSKSTTASGKFNASLYKGLNIRANAGFNSTANGENIDSSLGAGISYNQLKKGDNQLKKGGTRPSWGANISGGIDSSYVKRQDGTYAKSSLPALSGSVYKNVGKNTNITLGKSFNKEDKENNRGVTLGITSRF